MKSGKSNPSGSTSAGPKHSQPLGSQQALAEKAPNSQVSVKARVESQNMPDKPPLHLQNQPNSSGRK